MIDMLFTVDEARTMKSVLLRSAELDGSKHMEYLRFFRTIDLFSVLLALLMVFRSIFTLSIASVMLFSDGSIADTWLSGHAIVIALAYFIISVLPIIGNLFNLLLPVVVFIIAIFVGDGMAANFLTYLVPLIVVWVGCALSVFLINLIMNLVTKKVFMNVYKKIVEIVDDYDFETVSPGRMIMVPKKSGHGNLDSHGTP